MTLKEKILGDVITTLMIRSALQIRGLLLIPLLAYPLGNDVYGAYVQILIVTTILSNAFGLGLQSSLVNKAQSYNENSDWKGLYWAVFLLMMGSSIVGAGFLACAAAPLSKLTLGTSRFAKAFQVGSVLVPLFSLITLSKNYFRAKMRVKTFSLVNGAHHYLTVIFITAIVLVLEGGLMLVLAGLIASKLVSGLILQVIIIRDIGVRQPRTEVVDLIRYGISFMVSVLSSQFLTDVDKLLIGGFLGPESVAIYSAGYRVASGIRIFTVGITTSFFAEFNRLLESEEYPQVEDLLDSGVKYFLMFAFPATFGIFIIGSDIIELLLRSDGEGNIEIMLFLIGMGVVMYSISNIYSQLFYAADKISILVKINFICLIINIFLNILLIPLIGLLGAAVTTLFSYVLMTIAVWYTISKMVTATISLLYLSKVLISSFAFTFIFTYIFTPHPIIILIISPIIYFILMFLLKGVEYSDIKSVLDIFHFN